MTSDVVLTAALRNNLLSLQKTQSQVDTTQNRLATGKKINSALDGPQAFFASQALTNRASDLTRLLDSIGQSIQVIKAADNGVTALTKLVEQADSVAQSARDALAQGQAEAKVVGNRDLRGIDDLTALPGIVTGDIITFSITDSNGVAVNLGAYGGAAAATANITITTNTSTEELIASINNLNLQVGGVGTAVGDQAFEASLDAKGQLQIRTLGGNDFRAVFVAITAGGDPPDLALAADLGFSGIARAVSDGTNAANANTVEFTAIADVALRSYALTNTAGTAVALRSDVLSSLRRSGDTVNALFANINTNADDYTISINGGAIQTIELANAANTAVTIQDFIDDVNANTALNTFIKAEFDDVTGQLSFRAIDSTVKSIEIGLATGSTATANWGFGRQSLVTANAANGLRETIRLAAAAGDLAAFEKDFDSIRSQIDLLVQDTGYRGTNLLNGDDLTTFFNETRTSTLITSGSTFTAAGLSLDAANFSRTDSVDGALAQVRDALETVRTYSSSLASSLSIIQARETFTSELVNTLKEGADKLVNADQNEEGAKLLALQTRQSLGVTALSLASQSQQSILRLF